MSIESKHLEILKEQCKKLYETKIFDVEAYKKNDSVTKQEKLEEDNKQFNEKTVYEFAYSNGEFQMIGEKYSDRPIKEFNWYKVYSKAYPIKLTIK